ncbi:excinuclease ABC subunit UvrC [Leptospira sp. GIMC2001]|uniref:excinuclease ABC subunit UvrC n=1 Tax=Leptospira sp. GIMC2001 TaxID=1513297 RepID=UPI00234AA8D6|nr:excinuclease ABC subunit UvrC [Leptospira sp. GIMC2001]WCL48293.1 excinuclease ABC subunit UvrC [Leptospira sp. GIMC2001]
MKELILEKIKNLKDQPGCYLWKDIKGEVIYVGKALRLANRIRSYLNPNITDTKTRHLQIEIHDLDWFATTTEVEALILESTLIKKYNPKFNVRLKDDKRYPFICVSTSEMFPMVYLSRRPRANGDRYFGPFTDGRAARDALQMLHKIFPIRKTKLKLPLAKPIRPCLNFHIGRCLGPCQGNITKEVYGEMIDRVLQFLEGKKDILIDNLRARMISHSEKMEFELAAHFRDMLERINHVREKQTVVSVEGGDEDVVSFARRDNEGQVVLLEVRAGRLEAKKTFPLTGLIDSTNRELLESFLRDYYLQARFIPTTIYLPEEARSGIEPLMDHIQNEFGFRPKIRVPAQGQKKSLLRLAERNAELSLTERILATKLKDQTLALKELQENLNLSDLPRVIECYDISHIQGFEPVASGVMFVDGKPYKQGYRHYKIRGHEGINDPAMMHEVIGRRLQRLINEGEPLPDLVVIDGGPTQLNRACEVAIALDIHDLPMVGLAKKREEIYFPGEKQPYSFAINSPSMRLLRNLRDEAHRFGVTYHRLRRNKAELKLLLDDIADIGVTRRKNLLKYFQGKKKISDATFEELLQVDGIGEATARKIVDGLKKPKSQ